MRYPQARQHIETGDLIGIRTGTLSGKVIEAVQWVAGLKLYHVSHVGLAVWQQERLFIVEMNPAGNTYKPLSQYADRDMVICEPPAGVRRQDISAAIDQATETHIPYGFADLLAIGLRLLPLRLINTTRWGGDGGADQVCSFFAGRVYQHAGADMSALPSLPAPAEICQCQPIKLRISQTGQTPPRPRPGATP